MKINSINGMSSKLRSLLKEKEFLRVIESVNGLEALIAKAAQVRDEYGNIKEFDALWMSSFSHAAFKGMPDNGTMDFQEKYMTVKEIVAVADKPLIIDVDMVNEIGKLSLDISLFETAGAAGVVIEDKKGIKHNSLYGSSKFQEMETPEWFAKKIYCVKNILDTEDFMVFARTESLIAGESVAQAVERAKIYVNAGADGIVIHSISSDGKDVFEFAEIFKSFFPDIPLVFIPTVYNTFKDTELNKKGADIIIYANHLMRSAYSAMEKTAMSILTEGRSLQADNQYCVPAKTILNLIDGE